MALHDTHLPQEVSPEQLQTSLSCRCCAGVGETSLLQVNTGSLCTLKGQDSARLLSVRHHI